MSPHPLAPLEVAALEHVVITLGLSRVSYHSYHTSELSLTQHPVVALPLRAPLTRDLDEALIERQVVADRVLPALAVFTLHTKQSI